MTMFPGKRVRQAAILWRLTEGYFLATLRSLWVLFDYIRFIVLHILG
jgi:hypothetical protein